MFRINRQLRSAHTRVRSSISNGAWPVGRLTRNIIKKDLPSSSFLSRGDGMWGVNYLAMLLDKFHLVDYTKALSVPRPGKSLVGKPASRLAARGIKANGRRKRRRKVWRASNIHSLLQFRRTFINSNVPNRKEGVLVAGLISSGTHAIHITYVVIFVSGPRIVLSTEFANSLHRVSRFREHFESWPVLLTSCRWDRSEGEEKCKERKVFIIPLYGQKRPVWRNILRALTHLRERGKS